MTQVEASARPRRPGLPRPPLAALPAALLVVGLGLAPLALIAFWSFWRFDPATYWITPDYTLASYAALMDTGRLPVLLRTLGLSALTAALATLLALPAAAVIGLMSGPRKAAVLIALFTVPFFTSALIRAFAWRLVLGRNGAINQTLVAAGLIDEPLEWLLFSNFAVIVGMLAAYLPFAVVPLVLAFGRIEPSVIRASQDLGAGFWTTFRRVILPLVLPGAVAGFLFVFVVALGTSSEIQLLGGAGDSSISIMINDVMRVVNFPLAFAIATVVVAVAVAVLLVAVRFFRLSKLFEDLGT
ncbi:ABC transporter permease [Methylobrevis albus]|uniref:ABC transporter permease n=1 Tax=Methylobrevis albus TaxID=2793297 RepID=UPI001F2943A9|nr:ABC transporter permease [Methylobrevis albus]